jgi:hypothetical protein
VGERKAVRSIGRLEPPLRHSKSHYLISREGD